MKELMGFCGIDCEKCDVYIATKNKDEKLREKTAKLWSELNNATITPEMLYCEGCKSNGKKCYYCSDLCEISKCAKQKQFENCGMCSKAKHCETLAVIHCNNDDAKNNLGLK